MSNRSLTVKFGADTSGFSKGANQVKSELTELNSAMLQNKRKQKELAAEIKSLEAQQKALKQAMSQVKTPTKEMTDEAERLQKALDKATIQSAKLKTEEQELKTKISTTTKELKEQSTAADNNSISMEKVGQALKKAATLTATGMAALFTYTAKMAASSDEINTIAKQTGLATDEIQKFMYASELIDVSLDTLTGSMSRLIRNMNTAATTGSGTAYEAFTALGISITDTSGILRNNQDVFDEAIEKLGKIEDETQRDAYAMSIFGKSAQDLNPLILGGTQQLKEFGDELEREGLILDQMQLDKLNEFNDKIDTFKAKFQAQMMESSVDWVDAFDELLDKSDEIVELVATLITGFAKVTGFVVDYKEAVLSLVVAYGTFKAAMSVKDIISSVVSSVKSLTTATKTATVAQQGMNTAANLNPYLAVAAALTTIVSAMAIYTKQARSFEQDTLDNIKTMEERTEAVEDAVDQIRAENEVLKTKGERYEELRTKANRTAEEERELYNIATELESQYPNQITLIGNTAGAYYELGEQIDNVCKSLEEYALKKAYAAELEEMYVDRKELEDKIAEGEGIVKEQSEIANPDEIQSVSKLQERLNELNQEIALVESKLEGYTGSTENATDGIQSLKKRNENLAASLSSIKEVTQVVIDAEKELADTNALSSETLETLIAKYPDLQNEVNDYIEGKRTAKDIIDSLNIAYQNDVKNNASALQSKLNADAEYYQKLREMNDSAINTLATEYGVDLSNYQNYAEAKLAIEKAVLSSIAKNWADYYDAESRRWVGSVKNITVYYKSLIAEGMSEGEAEAIVRQKQQELSDTLNAVYALYNLDFSADLKDFTKYYVSTLMTDDDSTTNNNTSKKEVSVYEQAKASLTKLYNDRIEEIKALNDAEKAGADERIAAIEKEIEARKKLADTEDLQKRIDFVKGQLKYSQLDEFERSELERQLEDLLTEQEDQEWEESKRAEIEAIEAEKEAIQKANDELVQDLQNRLSYGTSLFTDLQNGYKSTTTIANNNSKTANINVVNNALTEGQVAQLVRDTLGIEVVL